MILRRDPAGVFRFAALQGEFARGVLPRLGEHGEGGGSEETMYVVLSRGSDAERMLSGADAALYILDHIRPRGPLRAAGFVRWLPRGWREALYRFVARRRYRWFGRYGSCPLPEPQWKERFLD